MFNVGICQNVTYDYHAIYTHDTRVCSGAPVRADAEASDVSEPPVSGVTGGDPQQRHHVADAQRLESSGHPQRV